MAVKVGRIPGPGYRALIETPDRKPPQGGSSTAPSKEEERSVIGFLKAIKARDLRTLNKVYQTGYQTCKTSGVIKAAMGEESGSAGGYLVPPDFTLQILEAFSEESFIYPRANVVPMASAEEQCPKVDIETVQSAGTAPYFGGIKFKWGSSQAATETEPTFRQMSLKAWDLLGYMVVANQWLEDIGPRGEDYIVKLLGKAAAWYAEYAFLQGSGAVQLMPLGILNAPALVTLNSTTANLIVIADIAKMTQNLIPYAWKHAVWATHPTCLTQIQQMAAYYINIEIGHPQQNGSQVGMLSTRPLFVTDKLPALGTSSNRNTGCS